MSDEDTINDLNKDPMYPNEDNLGEEGAGLGSVETPEPPAPREEVEGGIMGDIANKLGGGSQVEDYEGGIKTETPLAFDISKLSKDQLQALKSMLAATPDTGKKKQQKPQIKIRTIDGNIVRDFKNAYLALVRDSVNNRDVERHKIPVKFFGSEEYVDILYSNFMQAEFTVFEVVSTRREIEEIVEGETISRETGTPVDLVVKRIKDFFTIKLPSGELVEVPAKIANA